MSIADLVMITIPALTIVGAAVWLAGRERAADLVIDLRDAPQVQLAPAPPRTVSFPPSPVRGALVEPTGTGTLGARLRSAEDRSSSEARIARHPRSKVVIGRRRRPLVAVSRLREPR